MPLNDGPELTALNDASGLLRATTDPLAIMNQLVSCTPFRALSTVAPLTGLALALALGGCGTGKTTPIGSSAGEPGENVEHPAGSGMRSQTFFVEENRRGQASEMKIVGVLWGRLVDIYDESGSLQQFDMVVGEDIRTSANYTVSTNPVTDKAQVIINAAAGTDEFVQLLDALDTNLTPVQDKSLDPSELPPFSVMARNAALVVRFDDILDPRFENGMWLDSHDGLLLDPSTGVLNRQAIRLMTDYPPDQPFEARVILDPNHGDLADYDGDGVLEFHSTRVILDATVSDTEASESALPVNSLGLPASITTQEPNLVVRIPTKLDAALGQTILLTNPTGHPCAFFSNGPNDPNSYTDDVVRAFRSGGDTEITGDLNNGFLLDEEKPRVMGQLAVEFSGSPVPIPGVVDGYTLPQMTFAVPSCATTLKPGFDVITKAGLKALVLGFASQSGSEVTFVQVQVLAPAGGVLTSGAAQLQTSFNPAIDVPACFVRFSPNASQPPASDVSKNAHAVVFFSEPMDPTSLTSFDNFTLTRVESDPTAFDVIVGQVLPDTTLREFKFVPTLPLNHQLGLNEGFYLNLAGGSAGPTDLAGNPLEETLSQILFQLDPTEGTESNGGVALRFAGTDELYDDSFPELRAGQILYDLNREVILPRPVNRFSVAADRDKPVPSVMTPFPPGVQTPLSPLGSKMQTLWRYCDLGFSVTDETNINIDIEGISWAPIGAAVVSDAYDEFQIALTHSIFQPDEILNPMSGFPNYPNSGLVKTFANNILDNDNAPFEVVHPRDRGYAVNPADLFQAESGTLMMPWPMNKGISVEEFSYWTWRDTTVLKKGAPIGAGAMLAMEVSILGTGTQGVPYPTGQVPTAGLPVLMEFRCYPDDGGLGLNAFDISLASNSSARPNFRAFSTGGYDQNNLPVIRDPDLENEANGGFNPNSNPPGAITQGIDNSFYIGQLELVTRVSRVHTIWFDTAMQSPVYSGGAFNTANPVVEPGPGDQPAGTQVVLAYRGATTITGTDAGIPQDDITTNASKLDLYGDPITIPAPEPSAPIFLNNNNAWLSQMADIDGSKAFQVRISFISNPISSKTPELGALGFAWQQ